MTHLHNQYVKLTNLLPKIHSIQACNTLMLPANWEQQKTKTKYVSTVTLKILLLLFKVRAITINDILTFTRTGVGTDSRVILLC
jgi:hypothetical protein